MRLDDWVPVIGEVWLWDIEEIMTRTSSDVSSARSDHYCGDCGCVDGEPCVADNDALAWDDVIERRREDPHYEHVVESIREHGFTVPCTAWYDEDSLVVRFGDGHHRLAAALELGITEIPVVMAEPHQYISEDSFLWGYEDQRGADYGEALPDVPPPPTHITTRGGVDVYFDMTAIVSH